MPPTAHRIRPHARSDRPSAVEHPTYARHPSVRLDSCLRRNDGGAAPRSEEGPRRIAKQRPLQPPHPAQQLAPLRLRDRLTYEPRTGQIPHQPRPPNRRAAARSSPRSHQAAPTRRDAAAPARPRARPAQRSPCRPLTPRQIDPNQPPWHLRSPLSSLRPFPSFLRRQESMRPSNTRPQHHPPDGPPIRPHARSDRPSAVEYPTYARHPSVRLDSCLRRNDGGAAP